MSSKVKSDFKIYILKTFFSTLFSRMLLFFLGFQFPPALKIAAEIFFLEHFVSESGALKALTLQRIVNEKNHNPKNIFYCTENSYLMPRFLTICVSF